MDLSQMNLIIILFDLNIAGIIGENNFCNLKPFLNYSKKKLSFGSSWNLIIKSFNHNFLRSYEMYEFKSVRE